ncbi:immunity 42 family protein [Pseudomonas aeruginosa]|nr:immunity 42 family protein [Pseudomonas aeruginosa]
MIVGDPFYFALQFDVVDSWNSPGDSWRNGIFYLYVSGEKIFSVVDVLELEAIFSFYSKAPIEGLCVNDVQLNSADIYKSASEYFWGDGVEVVKGLFDLTATAMSDNGCFLYFLKTSIGDRLVWSVDGGACVKEVYLEMDVVLNVIKKLRSCSL